MYQNKKANNANTLWEEIYKTLMGRTLRKKHENDKRKILKYIIQFANHYGVFYFESLELGKDWNALRYSKK